MKYNEIMELPAEEQNTQIRQYIDHLRKGMIGKEKKLDLLYKVCDASEGIPITSAISLNQEECLSVLHFLKTGVGRDASENYVGEKEIVLDRVISQLTDMKRPKTEVNFGPETTTTHGISINNNFDRAVMHIFENYPERQEEMIRSGVLDKVEPAFLNERLFSMIEKNQLNESSVKQMEQWYANSQFFAALHPPTQIMLLNTLMTNSNNYELKENIKTNHAQMLSEDWSKSSTTVENLRSLSQLRDTAEMVKIIEDAKEELDTYDAKQLMDKSNINHYDKRLAAYTKELKSSENSCISMLESSNDRLSMLGASESISTYLKSIEQDLNNYKAERAIPESETEVALMNQELADAHELKEILDPMTLDNWLQEKSKLEDYAEKRFQSDTETQVLGSVNKTLNSRIISSTYYMVSSDKYDEVAKYPPPVSAENENIAHQTLRADLKSNKAKLNEYISNLEVAIENSEKLANKPYATKEREISQTESEFTDKLLQIIDSDSDDINRLERVTTLHQELNATKEAGGEIDRSGDLGRLFTKTEKTLEIASHAFADQPQPAQTVEVVQSAEDKAQGKLEEGAPSQERTYKQTAVEKEQIAKLKSYIAAKQEKIDADEAKPKGRAGKLLGKGKGFFKGGITSSDKKKAAKELLNVYESDNSPQEKLDMIEDFSAKTLKILSKGKELPLRLDVAKLHYEKAAAKQAPTPGK